MKFVESREEPATLFFATIPFRYLADTAPIWAERGVSGFLLAGIMSNWDSDVWQVEGARIVGERNPRFQLLREMNARCREHGLDRNFIKVAFYTQLPDWFDDDGWARLEGNFSQAAVFARDAGFRGVAIDIEYINEIYELSWPGYQGDGYPLDQLPQIVQRRGCEMVEAMLDEYPEMEVLHLPQSPECYGPLASHLFAGMVVGMAERQAPGGLHLLTEASYIRTDAGWLLRYHQGLDEIVGEALPDHLDYWRSNCSISFGLWPLGYYRDIVDEKGNFLGYGGKREVFGDRIVGSRADKSENYDSDAFREQFAAALMVCGRYVWIYCHGSTFWQLGPEELQRYGGSASDSLPVVPNLDEYIDVIRERRILGDRHSQAVARRLRRGDWVDFLSPSGSPSEWLLIGPFDNQGGEGFGRSHPPEDSPLRPCTVGGGAESPRWRNARVYSTGYVDLARYFRPPDYRLAYAFCNIVAPGQCEGRVLFGSDDGAKVWLNGELVYELDVVRGAVPDQEAIPVRLREGANPVLLKVVNRKGTWGFYFRVVGDDGSPIPGLAFSVETRT
jgi:hypothetical protein